MSEWNDSGCWNFSPSLPYIFRLLPALSMDIKLERLRPLDSHLCEFVEVLAGICCISSAVPIHFPAAWHRDLYSSRPELYCAI